MGLLLGLIAAMSWGIADLFTRHATRSVGSYRTLLFIQVISLVPLSSYLLETGTLQHLHTYWQPWAWALLAVLLNTVSSLSLYRAFEVGVLAIVSPIAASYSAITALLAVISGEAVSIQHGIGMGITLLGIALASAPIPKQMRTQTFLAMKHWRGKIPQGLTWAITASVGFGLFFWLLGLHVTPQFGSIVPIWLCRLATLCMLPLVAPMLHQSIRIPQGRIWWYLIGISILDTVGYIAVTIGFTISQTSLVTIISSLFSAVTFLLAYIFLREPLHWNQWLGISLIFIGIALVNM